MDKFGAGISSCTQDKQLKMDGWLNLDCVQTADRSGPNQVHSYVTQIRVVYNSVDSPGRPGI